MFQELGEKLETVLRNLRGQGKLTEKNIADSLREVRRALLEADVNYKVVKQFIEDVQIRAVGREVLKSITPGQMIIKIIYDELVKLMGPTDSSLRIGNEIPSAILLCGLQGSGKTTFAGKLALHLRKKGHNPLLVAADVYRPAAVDQLRVIAKSLGMAVYEEPTADAVGIAKNGVLHARKTMHDVAIIDTAGRLHIDDEMMNEIAAIKQAVTPSEILFVADAMTGQDAVNAASAFKQRIDFTGIVLTKLDGDARGGAALSIRAVTGRPIKFVGVGEKPDQLELFHAERMASRILGMGDVVTLVEKAQQAIDAEKAARLESRLRNQQFTLEDFLENLQQLKKMGPLQDILGMLPGMQSKALKGMQIDDRSLIRAEAIINSMTREERRSPHIINGSRRKRIAAGSGTTVQEVNRLLHQYEAMRQMIKSFKHRGKFRMPLGF
ncbi:MAG: signal recognition particle protein [candidate division KSB1 bacterium]|nr:signal recognition particle protein [candidate division KSB1 bacterium]MDZ7345647.1 signal recognition particle protein [candidate division KSB1 bacterium]